MFEFTENITLRLPDVSEQVKTLSEADQGKRNKILTEIAAIHVGLTGNFNMYTEEALAASITSWVDPYPKPILTNHDELAEPMGRVMAAKMAKEADGTPYIALQAAIIDPNAVEKVLDERYITGSVGGRSASAKCSICGTDWAQAEGNVAPCRHKRGKVYEGKLAYFELGGISWKEYSFVNIPGDKKSQLKNVVTSGVSEANDGWVRAVKLYSMDMNQESIMSLEENEKSHNVLDEMKKIEAAFTYRNIKGTFLTTTAFDLGGLLEKENHEKITFIQNDTTIESETVENDHIVASEEKKNMPKNDEAEVQEEDILAIADNLRADRNSEDSEVSANEEDSNEEVTDESPDGSEQTDSVDDSEEVDVPVKDKPVDEPTGEAVDTETETVEEETAETQDDQSLVGSEDAVSDAAEVQDSNETSEEADSQEDAASAELQARVDSLLEENARLKKHLHYMLAERVVDAKIAVGVVEYEDRSVALTEHEARTASSLADALKDIEKLAAAMPERVKHTPLMEMRAKAVEGEDAAVFEDVKETAPQMSDEDRAIAMFSEALMGRKSL
jgi:hypothetical protein